MTLPVFYVHVFGDLHLGEYVVAETRGKAKAIATGDAHEANYDYRYTDMRALRCYGDDGTATVADVLRARNLGTYEVFAHGLTRIAVSIDRIREAEERRRAGVAS